MKTREWHEAALNSARHGLFELQVARQAMMDARRALECAGDKARADEVHRILMESHRSAPALQALVNALQSDPILDKPMDIMSSGEVSPLEDK